MKSQDIRANDWLVSGAHLLQFSSAWQCPQCQKPFMCKPHQFIYLKWWKGFAGGRQINGDQDVPIVFHTKSEAMTYRYSRGV